MKTKIVYISGGEIFDIADVRDALNQVRNTLGLAEDTIMFGIPVDADDALADTTPATATMAMDAAPQAIVPQTEEEPVAAVEPQEEKPAPIKQTTKRKSAKKIKEEEPVAETQDTDAPIVASTDDAPVVPILSILATNNETPAENVTETIVEEELNEAPVAIAEEDDIEMATEIEEEIKEEIIEQAQPIIDEPVVQSIHITDDMMDAPVPDIETEKTLEELLESMTPLREDNIPGAVVENIAADDVMDEQMPAIDDADATLEQLASEFAQKQDTLPTPKKGESHGKIGKLKNILPFKKVKRDDTGLMGDLFGWAGIAANDEDFSIPGFFTTAASKK